MNKKVVRQFVALIGICIVTLLVNLFYSKTDDVSRIHGEISLSQNWQAIVNSEDLGTVSLDDKRFDMFNRGDSFILVNTLPEELPEHPVIKFYNIHSAIKIYVDEELRYDYGFEEYESGKLLGYGFHYISLNDSDAGKSIRIEQTITENDAFSSQEAPIIADGDYVIRDFAVKNRIRIAIISFQIMFGIVMSIVATIYALRNREMLRLLWVGLFSISVGVWSFCTTDLIEIFLYDLNVKTFLEFGMLYLAPLFLFLYFRAEIKTEGNIRWQIYHVILVLQTFFSVCAWVFQLTGVVRFPTMLKVCHMMMALMVVFLVIRFLSDMFRGVLKTSPLIYGFEFLAVFVFYDLARFNIQKFIPLFNDDHYVSLIYFGVLIFVITMLIDFAVKYIRNLYEQAEKDALARLAFTDSMTGAANRRSVEDMMDEIDSENKPYVILGFDLNDLKKVNDTLGHEEGDRYIRSFSEALTHAFGSSGLVGRMGGDEFSVILYKEDRLDYKTMLQNLKNDINELNAKNSDWSMSTAYGECLSTESGITSIRQASKIADERMYRCKAEMKHKNS